MSAVFCGPNIKYFYKRRIKNGFVQMGVITFIILLFNNTVLRSVVSKVITEKLLYIVANFLRGNAGVSFASHKKQLH